MSFRCHRELRIGITYHTPLWVYLVGRADLEAHYYTLPDLSAALVMDVPPSQWPVELAPFAAIGECSLDTSSWCPVDNAAAIGLKSLRQECSGPHPYLAPTFFTETSTGNHSCSTATSEQCPSKDMTDNNFCASVTASVANLTAAKDVIGPLSAWNTRPITSLASLFEGQATFTVVELVQTVSLFIVLVA